jgi:hypothetical protein
MTFESTPDENEPEPYGLIQVIKHSCINILWSVCATSRVRVNLAGRHSLGDHSLQCKLLLLQVIGRGIFNLELSHSIT